MNIKSTDGTAELGIWFIGVDGFVRITSYGDLNATFDAAELINAIQKETA